MNHCRAAASAALFLFFTSFGALAETVTLSSQTGGFAMRGTLMGYDGEFYRLDTEHGVLSLDAARVECSGAGCPDLDGFVPVVTFSGARALGETLLPALIETFASRNGYSVTRDVVDDLTFSYELAERSGGSAVGRFDFRLTSSDEGMADLLAEVADIALSLREATGAEIAAGRGSLLGDLNGRGRSRIIALDGIVPLVSVGNPLAEIGLSQLRSIFAGEIADWSELTGLEQPITLHLRDDASGQAQAFLTRVMGRETALAEGITRHDSNAAIADAVARDPGALGIGSYSEMGNAMPVALKGPCGFASVASETSLKTEDYPLTAPLFAYLPNYRLPQIGRRFLAYMNSPAAQPVIRRAGFVDQFPRAIPLDAQGHRFATAIARAGDEIGLSDLQRLVRVLSNMTRLTLTFRFEDGAAQLDPQSRSNIALLGEALERGVFDDRALVFVGFSDGLGPAGLNRRLSRERARTVRDAVRRASHGASDAALPELEIEAFGEAMPMACDETEWGRGVNRRVEVWLR
ncbi:phosphate ABC transporter substrate-binding/OmpA family protein [Profundibacterium mesophilum]|uniref:OmpA domain-containing protein n=1 Tax=Profundibacterium mesophilum KAUST100406-0324 TaxID=1037889 RepID=A0A921NRG6_9RHOB|nr:phosphate ABC transporter substrate-binding/OmpA family protein [Profundibacterium mesophilum]KAF0676370.1 OmpA domain-containing protein [Profundibacterium mesophilum KAUST100406-0324]